LSLTYQNSIKILLLCFGLTPLFAGVCQAQSTYVPLNHWVYQFVERFEARGVIHGVLNGSRPFSRDEMTRYLRQIEKSAEQGASLNSVEQEQFNFLKLEFSEEFSALTGLESSHFVTRIERIKNSGFPGKILPKFIYRNNRNMLNFSEEPFRLYIDPVFYQQILSANSDSLTGAERVFERTHGFKMRGNLGSHIGFHFDFRDSKEWGSRSYPKQFDISLQGLGFVNGYGSHIWHDETNAYLMFKLPYMQLMLGKDWNYWGPGANGALGLSDNATSFDQIKLQSRVWRLKFTWLLGSLRTFPRIINADGKTNPKSMVAHRLEIDVAKWLDVGLYEMVVFGNRRFELAYINPINFYRSAEHFVGDDDNASMGVDVEFLLIPNVKLYGELYVDDLSTSKSGNYFGNKTGLLVGGLWVDAFQLPNLNVRVEYARTRPYLYTHRNAINTYTHFNTGLGHKIGPNAELFTASLKYQFSRRLQIAASFERFRHGANLVEQNINNGGDITRPFTENDFEIARFLAGSLESRRQLGFEVKYEVFRNFFFQLQMNTSFFKNALIANATRGNVNRNEVSVNISLNH